jgi:hypothetical protein
MFRLLSDENFNDDIVRGLLLRQPNLDLVRALEVSLQGAEDPDVLARAAADDRVVLTHDRATMPDFAYARAVAGEAMPGLFVVHDRMSVGQAIDELLLVAACST